MSLIQLNPPLPVTTPKGPALAHFLIDEGIEHNVMWVCFQDINGECWTWPNPQIRAARNITYGRDYISPFYNPDSVALKNNSACCSDCGEDIDECICDEGVDWEAVYNESAQEWKNNQEKLTKISQDNIKLTGDLMRLKGLLVRLIKDDHIFGNSRQEVKDALNSTINEDGTEY